MTAITLHSARLVLPALAILLAACASSDGSGVPSAAFDEVFVEVNRITLEEPPRLSITEVREINVASDGRIVLADPPSQSVRIHAPDGTLQAAVGRHGEGPGEFRMPFAALLHESTGMLYVLDTRLMRVSRFDEALEFDTTFFLQRDWNGAWRIAQIQDDLLIHAIPSPIDQVNPVFRRFDADLNPAGAFHVQDSVYFTVPYWRDLPGESVAVGSDRIFVSNDKIYPLYTYSLDGQLIGTFGSPPPSWRQASRPERGEFGQGPAGLRMLREWKRTYTWIDRVALYGNSLLVVSHGSLDPEVIEYNAYHFKADVYHTDGTKLWEDIPLPGRLMAGGEMLTLLVAEPPEGWVLGRFHLRETR